MAASIGAYIIRGPATPGATFRAGLMDWAISVFATILIWPFPFARATLEPVTHAVALLGTLLLVDFVYRALMVKLWGRTLGMYYFDLGLSGPDRPFPLLASVAWALGWTIATVPATLGLRGLAHPDRGIPARLSGLITVASE